MRKLIAIALAGVMLLTLGAGLAFAGKGNDFPSGPHYELGIIGRPNDYDGSGTDNSNRHTIFIPLNTSGYVDGKVQLYMQQGSEWLVIDGDATDGRGTFQIAPGYYAVFARALGKPGGNINFSAFFTYWVDGGEVSDAILLGYVDLTRGVPKDGQWVGTKPQTVNISKLFYYTGDVTTDSGTTSYTNKWVFDIPEFYEYWWDIANNGLKRLEVRFYPVAFGYEPPPLP